MEDAALDNLAKAGWTLVVREAGLGGELIRRLSHGDSTFIQGEIIQSTPQLEVMKSKIIQLKAEKEVDIALGVFLIPGIERQEIYIILASPKGVKEISRPYGGPPGNAPLYAVNHCLDILRNL